jgi:hypothetical protein
MTHHRILALLVLTSVGSFACRNRPSERPPHNALIVIQGDAPTNSSSCEDRLEFARQTMDELVDAANGYCTVDADCTLVFAETQCRGACHAAILGDRLDAFRAGQEDINERACTHYVEDGCPYATPTCLAVDAVCDAGRCATRASS